MNAQVDIQVGSRVRVSFTSESRTEFSNQLFEGEGTVDLFDDLYVMGRLDTGLPFMCGYADLTVVDLNPINLAIEENEITEEKVIEAIISAKIFSLDGIAEALENRGFDFNNYCSCDPNVDVAEGRKESVLELIERINQFGLKDAIQELKREGFSFGVTLQAEKLES